MGLATRSSAAVLRPWRLPTPPARTTPRSTSRSTPDGRIVADGSTGDKLRDRAVRGRPRAPPTPTRTGSATPTDRCQAAICPRASAGCPKIDRKLTLKRYDGRVRPVEVRSRGTSLLRGASGSGSCADAAARTSSSAEPRSGGRRALDVAQPARLRHATTRVVKRNLERAGSALQARSRARSRRPERGRLARSACYIFSVGLRAGLCARRPTPGAGGPSQEVVDRYDPGRADEGTSVRKADV